MTLHAWHQIGSLPSLPDSNQVTDGVVVCSGVELIGQDGTAPESVSSGQRIEIVARFSVTEAIDAPVSWIEIRDTRGQLVFGKNSAQSGESIPLEVLVGAELLTYFAVRLDLGTGTYSITIGVSSTDGDSYGAYRYDLPDYTAWPYGQTHGHDPTGAYDPLLLPEEEFRTRLYEHCRVLVKEDLVVGFDRNGRRTHDGLVNIPATCSLSLDAQRGLVGSSNASAASADPDFPTVVHVTHWKAGSQWVAQILHDCAPERVARPLVGARHFLPRALQPGRIYPTVYLPRERFDRAQIPSNARVFVVIRDLRDTLVSGYFSLLKSHDMAIGEVHRVRPMLSTMDIEDGLLYLMEHWLSDSARIQLSWLEAGQRLIRYEDLVENDLALFDNLLREECGLPLSKQQVRSIILANRFERYTGGRARGEEDQGHHFRKGVAGDWKNHFTERVTAAFKARYGGLLVATGYEPDLDW